MIINVIIKFIFYFQDSVEFLVDICYHLNFTKLKDKEYACLIMSPSSKVNSLLLNKNSRPFYILICVKENLEFIYTLTYSDFT